MGLLFEESYVEVDEIHALESCLHSALMEYTRMQG
jgi:hypothetical protein